jgi:hypothetical protein
VCGRTPCRRVVLRNEGRNDSLGGHDLRNARIAVHGKVSVRKELVDGEVRRAGGAAQPEPAEGGQRGANEGHGAHVEKGGHKVSVVVLEALPPLANDVHRRLMLHSRSVFSAIKKEKFRKRLKNKIVLCRKGFCLKLKFNYLSI